MVEKKIDLREIHTVTFYSPTTQRGDKTSNFEYAKGCTLSPKEVTNDRTNPLLCARRGANSARTPVSHNNKITGRIAHLSLSFALFQYQVSLLSSFLLYLLLSGWPSTYTLYPHQTTHDTVCEELLECLAVLCECVPRAPTSPGLSWVWSDKETGEQEPEPHSLGAIGELAS